MKPEDSTPTGPTEPTGTPKNQLAVGSSAGQTVAAILPLDTSKAAAWLAARSPEEVNSAALSRASQLNVALRVRSESRFPEGGGFYQVIVGCDVEGGTAEERARALKAIRGMETPAPRGAIEGWLAELSVIVARKQGAEFDETLRLDAYTKRLADYPADIARAAVLERVWKFWPSWEELKAECDRLFMVRRHMAAALERKPDPDADRPLPGWAISEEERERRRAVVAEITRKSGLSVRAPDAGRRDDLNV